MVQESTLGSLNGNPKTPWNLDIVIKSIKTPARKVYNG